MKYRKRPIVIEAVRWLEPGDHPAVRRYELHLPGSCERCGEPNSVHGHIKTPEGDMDVCPGDWIITGVKGEVYPCKPDVFGLTYEPVIEVVSPGGWVVTDPLGNSQVLNDEAFRALYRPVLLPKPAKEINSND